PLQRETWTQRLIPGRTTPLVSTRSAEHKPEPRGRPGRAPPVAWTPNLRRANEFGIESLFPGRIREDFLGGGQPDPVAVLGGTAGQLPGTPRRIGVLPHFR